MRWRSASATVLSLVRQVPSQCPVGGRIAPELEQCHEMLVGAKGLGQPGAGECPLTIGRSRRDAQCLSGLGQRQSGEEPKLNQVGGLRIFNRQALQRVVEVEKIVGRSGNGIGKVVESNTATPETALQPA